MWYNAETIKRVFDHCLRHFEAWGDNMDKTSGNWVQMRTKLYNCVKHYPNLQYRSKEIDQILTSQEV